MSSGNKLWSKASTSTSQLIETFTVGRDKDFDVLLAEYDVLGSLAHTEMLASVGLLSHEDFALVKEGLSVILGEIRAGSFVIEKDVEDVHSQVELLLTNRIGEAGKKIHSGRSRNDQVAVDIKLYLRAQMLALKDEVAGLFGQLISLSDRYKNMLLPGYTHLQIAMPSSFGLWFGAYAESLVDDLEVLAAAYHVANKNPLGSGAGYGSSFPLDRELTTRLLHLGAMNVNSVYAQMSRGKTEKIVAMGLATVAATLSKLAMDCCLYINQNFGFISFPPELTTGSSIMPHKKNPDVFELIRAKCNRIQSTPNELTLLINNLPSGYHRDMQLTKEILFPAIGELTACLQMTGLMLSQIEVKDGILEDEKYKYLFSVEAVNELVNQGVPFREAYKQVGNQIDQGQFHFDYKKGLHHTHTGSIGNPGNEAITAEMRRVLAKFEVNWGYEKILPIAGCCPFAATRLVAQSPDTAMKTRAMGDIQSHSEEYKKIALQIWDYAEVGYKEVKSSALLQKTLTDNGFTVKAGVAEIPTAFVAAYGSGSPVIGILAEFDALPGLSQQAVPEKMPVEGKNAGHGCGHHLFGTASVAAGIEIKKLIAEKKFSGTIRVYGCPAEEGGSGKVYMVRAGLFNDVDVVIHWHPGSGNSVTLTSALANKSAKFRFHGLSAHAAMAPDKGRSALDGVEAMDYMVNMMREHIPQETRIHYVITNGGKAPNVVPDFAEVYYVRHPKKDEVMRIFDWVAKAAEGAAMGTQTSVDYEVIGGTHDLLLNRSLAEDMQQNLLRVGGVNYTPAEVEFAKKIQASFTYKVPAIETVATIEPLKVTPDAGGGSTDVGDVSYAVPTVGMEAATWVAGVPAHSWQATACGGTEIGTKGMIVAAKTMTLTAIDCFTNPALVAAAKEEFRKDKGDYQYKALLGDRKPALNYRD